MITAHEFKLSDVLGDQFLHEIPPYQRPYAWTSVEAQELFDDLREAAKARSNDPYFLGSIVLIKPAGTIVGHVLDGQQRLTTLTILAAVLRDIAEDPQEREALSAAVYIEPNPFKNQVEAVRLHAHAFDRVFFRQAVQIPGATAQDAPPHAPQTEAQELMWNNAAILRKRVLELNTVERQRLVTYLLNQCILVVVSTESRGAALRIFRVLNDRGLDLSNADVIKADLLEKFPDEGELAHHAELWRQWENDLGRDSFEGLLETLRFIKEQEKNRRALSDAYQERFKDADAQTVRDFFQNELAPAKEVYSKILDADTQHFPAELQNRVSEALVGLDLLPNRDWVPAALAAYLELRFTEQLVDVLERLEGIAWAMQLARRYDTQRLNRYVQVLKGLQGGDDVLKAALVLAPDENIDAWQALTGPLYERFPTRVVRAMLERLDRLLAEQAVLWDGTKTVEHILPQNPSTGTWTEFSPQQRETFTHTLGNLVLLTRRKNAEASNLNFDRKKVAYFGLGEAAGQRRIVTYASVLELAGYSTWNSETYAERQQKHVTALANHWGITAPETLP